MADKKVNTPQSLSVRAPRITKVVRTANHRTPFQNVTNTTDRTTAPKRQNNLASAVRQTNENNPARGLQTTVSSQVVLQLDKQTEFGINSSNETSETNPSVNIPPQNNCSLLQPWSPNPGPRKKLRDSVDGRTQSFEKPAVVRSFDVSDQIYLPISLLYDSGSTTCEHNGSIICATNNECFDIPDNSHVVFKKKVARKLTTAPFPSSETASIFEIGETSGTKSTQVNQTAYQDLGSLGENECLSDFDDDSDLDEPVFIDYIMDLEKEIGYHDLKDPTWSCSLCGAFFWYEERISRDRNAKKPIYKNCCMGGQVVLPMLQPPPKLLNDLMNNKDTRSKHFLDNIRGYNMMFAFTSMGGKVDHKVNTGSGPYCFRLHGQNYHRIGTLIPEVGETPKFAQLYIYDTENEVTNRDRAASGADKGIDVKQKKKKKKFDQSLIKDLQSMVDNHFQYAKTFRAARDKIELEGVPAEEVKLVLIDKRHTDGREYNLPSASEVAALIIGMDGGVVQERDIVLQQKMDGQFRKISELSAMYVPLQYPLLHPYGEDGYRRDILRTQVKVSKAENPRMTVSCREFFSFRFHERKNESNTPLQGRRLFQQHLVDAFTMMETERLRYLMINQKMLRADNYSSLNNIIQGGQTDPKFAGKNIILPATYIGGDRYMRENYQDAMAICLAYGYPNLFITFTCNPKWPEIDRFVKERGLHSEDRPDIISRVFKMKLTELCEDLRKEGLFGPSKAVVFTVEFQKRGLPHAHILLFLQSIGNVKTSLIDSFISAEIPDETDQPMLHELVKQHMMHGPCGTARPGSPCMHKKKCTKRFPKSFCNKTSIDEKGYPVYRRRDNGRTVMKSGVPLDNRYVVPYNAKLLLKYQAHINVEWCNQTRSIKYLFKYVHKGSDRISAKLTNVHGDAPQSVNEIKQHLDARYVSACEAAWRIFGFDIHYRSVGVQRLQFHLPGEHGVVFNEFEDLETAIEKVSEDKSMFIQWMRCNKTHESIAKNLIYSDFPSKFVWSKATKSWHPRKQGASVGRIYHVAPTAGEKYYLRILLNVVPGPQSYEDLRTFNKVVHPSFKDACFARGLLGDDREYIEAIKEAAFWGGGHYLRKLFVTSLFQECLAKPERVWEETWEYLKDGIEKEMRASMNNFEWDIPDERLKEHTLVEIERILRSYGKSFCDYPNMEVPSESSVSVGMNRLVLDELQFDREQLARDFEELSASLTPEQQGIYTEIMSAVDSGNGGVFFLYGYGGTGKTFLWNTLSASIRSSGDIVLTVASSGIAALLLPMGRTGHSRFAIPIQLDEYSTCNVKADNPLVDLLWEAKLIIWDEAPMVHKHCFEALDKTLKDVLRKNDPTAGTKPFGGKTIVFGGDFRQILPVVAQGSRADIVNATINSSKLWQFCKVLRLTVNMRLSKGSDDTDSSELKEFADWILKVGDGELGGENDGECEIPIPSNFVLSSSDGNHVQTMVDSTYPDLLSNISNGDYFKERAILCPTNEVVLGINNHMLSMMPGEEIVYKNISTCFIF